MSRIAYRALVLLTCTIACASLIAARPLPSNLPISTIRGETLLVDGLPTPELPASGATRGIAASAAAAATALPLTAASSEPARLLLEAAQAPHPVVIYPARIPGDGPPMRGSLVAQTERLDIYIGKQTFSPEQVAAFAPVLEQLLRDDEARLGTTLKHRISIAFYRAGFAPSRGVRGMAFTDEGRAELYYRPNENLDRAATIAAHEIGHHLEAQRYGEGVQRGADTILLEGLATWIAGDRWLTMCGGGTWKGRARQLGNAGIPLRLLTAERSGADNAYELWASFVDFLIQRYGWDQFDALYRSGRGRAPGSSNYQRVLGKSLDALADEWRDWVTR